MDISVSPSQRKEDFVEEFLTCSICTEPFDNTKHQAKCLPCLHTYCRSCLHSYAGKDTQFNCPTCRRELSLTGESIDSLPNNFIVENLKEYKDIFNTTVACGSCEGGNQAVGFCHAHTCGCFLCQGCVDNHKVMRPLRYHKISSIAEIRKCKYNPKMQQQQNCEKHPEQDLTLYCREAHCKIPVCATCGLVTHQGHNLMELAAASDEIVAELQQSCTRVNDRNQELTRNRATLDVLKNTLTDNFNQIQKDIQESEQKLQQVLKTRYNKAHYPLKHMYQTEMDHLTASIESMDTLIAQMNSACEFANKAYDTSHPTQLLTSQINIIRCLRELEKSELPKTMSDKTNFVFTDKHSSVMTQTQESLQHLFDIDWLAQPQTFKDEKKKTTSLRGRLTSAPSKQWKNTVLEYFIGIGIGIGILFFISL